MSSDRPSPTNHHEPARAPSEAMPSDRAAREAVVTLLRWLGENPDRDGLKQTPDRVLRAYREMFAGYTRDPLQPLQKNFAHGEDCGQAPVLVRDIAVRSFCEHHMLPIVGRAHVAYWPSHTLPGLSKVARTVETLCRRLQSQERLTREIGQAFEAALTPLGVLVMVEATHHCMVMRGVNEASSVTETFYIKGIFEDNPILSNATLMRMGARG